ncbi:MAG: LLM class flavin-dependent oxidoreductase [Rhodospirillales bacterium]|nr:LLM class flavin-dependent oxidoreductase [Rhodospirillales bacterium]
MKFGAMVATKIDDWKLLKEAEDLGYDHAWVPDSQMIWSDCYATLALVAEHTSRIKIGTGVAITGTRTAPVTAHSIASINRLAPGRTFLGIGTGHTAMRVMGMNPTKPKAFREYLRIVRGLLHGEEIEYTLDGQTQAIKFLHLDRNFIDIEHEIPIYVAANGPTALKSAGAYGDGRISALSEPAEMTSASLDQVKAGAEEIGRAVSPDFHTAALTTGCVLRPKETLKSDRVVDECGSQVAAAFHYVYEVFKLTEDENLVPPAIHDVWESYCQRVEQMETPEEKRYLELHEGHCSFLVPEERRFVTPEAIQTFCLAGEPDEIIDELRRREKSGLKEITLLPPMDYARNVFRDFSELVMAKY